MKKIFALLIAVVVFAAGAQAQQVTPSVISNASAGYHFQFGTSFANGTTYFNIPVGMTTHQLTYSAPGFSAITVTVNAGVGGSMSSVGSSSTTGAATITWTGTYTQAQMVVSGIAGSGQINADYYAQTTATGSGGGSGSNVNIADVGGNPVTTTVPISGTVTVTDGAGSLNVIVDSGTIVVTQPTAANLNATVVGTGTFVTQSSITAGSAQIGHLEANQSTNEAQINGVTPLMGNGVSGTGAQRVTLASDSTGQVALAAGTAAIGSTGVAQGSTTSGQIGELTQCAVTTGAPTYSNAQTSPINCDTVGNVRVTFNASGSRAATAPTVALQDGGKGVNAEQSAVTNGQLQSMVTDLVGKLIVLPYANPENFVMGTTAAVTDTTSTSVIASAGGSLRNYITQCTGTNSSATTGTFIKILDGASIIYEAYAGISGGGFVAVFPTPLKGTAATAVNAQAVTTGTNFIVSCSGYKGL